jgi:hypothetical protein
MLNTLITFSKTQNTLGHCSFLGDKGANQQDFMVLISSWPCLELKLPEYR